eukprot:507818-Amphidinium_carterae.1
MPALASALLPWKFVLTSERYVEASHSLVKRMVPSNHSPVLVSLTRRLPRFEMHIAIKPQHLQEVITAFARARKITSLPALLKLENHPTFAGYWWREENTKVRDAIVFSLA